MNAAEFKTILTDLGIKQTDLALLIGVTPRAISLWVTQARSVPDPVAAYLRLLVSLPKALQEKELARLKNENPGRYEGMYTVTFHGRTGEGLGVFVLTQGAAFGADSGSVQYDGIYQPSATQPGSIDITLRVSVPPVVALVQGVPPQPIPYSFDLSCSFAARGQTPLTVQTPFGHVQAQIDFIRSIPN
jgi:hypothetical protein